MPIRSLIQTLRRPSARYSLGMLIAAGFVVGVIAVPSFTYAVYETSTDKFCLTCHSGDIGLEMAGTAHYENATGFRAGCADCHLPKAFWPKVIYKTKAGVKDVYHTMLGTIDTYEKFEAHRMTMATRTWAAMNANDSRECRYCHDEARWDVTLQTEKARDYHSPALAKGKTCIDCHAGLTHTPPEKKTDQLSLHF